MEFEQLRVLGSPGLPVLPVSPQDRFVPDHHLQEQTKKPHAKTAGQADKSVIPMVFMIYTCFLCKVPFTIPKRISTMTTKKTRSTAVIHPRIIP